MFVSEDKLAKLIQEAVVKALTVEMTLEKVKDDKTGTPLATKEIIKEEVFLPSFLSQILSQNEGATRGLQEQICMQSNKINKLDNELKAVGNIIISTENSLKCLATLTDDIKQITNTEIIQGETLTVEVTDV